MGKDPTNVDRSAAYAARQVAKSLVAAGLARRVLVQLAYAIGVAKPVSVLVETFGTSEVPEEELVGLVRRSFPLTPSGMIEALGLRGLIYLPTAPYGHFGRAEAGFPWEAGLPLVEARGTRPLASKSPMPRQGTLPNPTPPHSPLSRPRRNRQE